MRASVLLGVGGIIEVGSTQSVQTFNVAAGETGTLNLAFGSADLVSLFKGGFSGTLEVSDGNGNWTPVQSVGNGTGLLDLLGLLGSNSSIQIPGLAAGEYRFTLKVEPSLLYVGANAAAQVSVTNESLTDFTGEVSGPVTGNVITDPGIDGNPDVPGGSATLQVEVNGEFVDAGTTGTVLQGLYGQLTIFADGSYSYLPNGSVESIGKVDAFEYHLVNAAGTSTANLYVRIGSPDGDITWNPDDPSAPGLITPVANDDIGTTQINLIPEVGPEETLAGFDYNINLLLGRGTGTGSTILVAENTTADLKVSAQAGGVTLLGNNTLVLQKFVDGAWANQQTITGATHTFTGLDEGSYRVMSTTVSAVSLGGVVVTEKLTTTYLNQLVPGLVTPATGNVLTDTLAGADKLGSSLTVLSVLDQGGYVIPGQVGLKVEGTYGTLTLFADGQYVYTVNAGFTAAQVGQVDKFTYKLTSPTGESDTADLYIRLDSPDRDLVWDDTNPGAPATEAPALAALAVEESASTTDDGAATDGSGDHSDSANVADTDFAHVASGAGTEGLLWEGSDAAINLTDLIGKVSGIDTIDLNDVSAVDLTLSLEDLVSITGPEADRLVIQGDDQDSVHLTGNWSSGVSQVENGLEYVIYTSPEDQTHQLWVQSGITVV